MALTLAVVALAGVGLVSKTSPTWEFAEQTYPDPDLPVSFETVFNYTSSEGTAHAPAILPGPGGTFGLIWFDGIRESHNDVRILGAAPPGGDVQTILTRQAVSRGLQPAQTVLTLGNTISDARGGLLATSVSLGGWAASFISHVPVNADGVFQRARRLDLSPLIGRSHLVKSPVVEMNGGYRGLPTYFEMGNAFGVVALMDKRGRVRAQSDMRGGARAIQPMIVPFSAKNAVALLRNFDPIVEGLLVSWTTDGGKTWSAPLPVDLSNPSAPVAAIGLDDGRVLMAFNDASDTATSLTLATSADQGRTWERGPVFESPDGRDLRYPMMGILGDGRIVLTYSTGSKTGIVSHVFSQAWAVQP